VEAFPGLGPPAKKPGGWAGVPAPPPARHVVPRTAKVAPAPVLPSKNQKKASTPVRRPPQSSGGLRVIDRRIPDSDEENFPSMEQPHIALNNFSKLTVKNSGQDLSYSRDEASSNIKTVDRSVFEAQQAAQNSSASSKSKPDLKSEAFPGLGAPERKLEFPVPGNKKKTKNIKNVPAINHNSAKTTTLASTTASANSKTGSSSLSSICDFLGGNDKKVEEKKVAQKPKEEKTDWETADSQGIKEKTAETRNDIKPIVSKVKAPAAVEEVYRPSKVKKNHSNEEARDMRPTSRGTANSANAANAANDDFPSLDGSSKKLGANFVKAEDKIFKPKVTPSQWDQNEIKIRMTESVSEEPEKTHGNVKERRAPPGFTKDFPTLGGPEAKKAPPGFGNPRNSSTATSGPPPGFGPKNNRSNHKYTPPENFEARNSALITTITGLIGGKSLEFKTFKEISGQFRRGQLNSDSYFTQCRALVSKDDFDKFFPELVVLLPDITMQGELLELYLKSEGKAPTQLRPCSVCQQVSLVGEESDYHNKTHSLDLDFPRL